MFLTGPTFTNRATTEHSVSNAVIYKSAVPAAPGLNPVKFDRGEIYSAARRFDGYDA